MLTTPLSFIEYLGFSKPFSCSVSGVSYSGASLPLGEVTVTSLRPLGLSGVLEAVEEAVPVDSRGGTTTAAGVEVRLVVDTAVSPPTAAAGALVLVGAATEAALTFSPFFSSWIRPLLPLPVLAPFAAVEPDGTLRLCKPPEVLCSTSEMLFAGARPESSPPAGFFRMVVSLSP